MPPTTRERPRATAHNNDKSLGRESIVKAPADLDAFRYSRPIDIEVAISRMPKGLHAPIAFSLTVVVDAAGAKSSCEPAERMDGSLASIACKQIMDNYPVTRAHNVAGASVPSVQNALVSFVTE